MGRARSRDHVGGNELAEFAALFQQPGEFVEVGAQPAELLGHVDADGKCRRLVQRTLLQRLLRHAAGRSGGVERLLPTLQEALLLPGDDGGQQRRGQVGIDQADPSQLVDEHGAQQEGVAVCGFEAVIDGMMMDVEEDICAPDWETLELYCDRVASAVGRLSVRAFGLVEDDGIRCMLWSSGRPKDAGMCRVHLRHVNKSPSDEIERARKKLVQSAPYAVDVLEELMQTATSEPVRLKASTEILDRAGVRGGVEIEANVSVTETRPATEIISERLNRLANGAIQVAGALAQQGVTVQPDEDVQEAEVTGEQPTGA